MKIHTQILPLNAKNAGPLLAKELVIILHHHTEGALLVL